MWPTGEVGEVLVRGDVVMTGYWRNPEATAETLRGGWLHTGDMGAFDEDGYLTLKDRSKDLIISGGSNIYPREVEEVLLRHPGVLEVSVIGRPHDDMGEEVVAFVVPRPDAGTGRRPRSIRSLHREHGPLQAPARLPLHRRAAQEQLRQGAEDRAPQERVGSFRRRATLPPALRAAIRRLSVA